MFWSRNVRAPAVSRYRARPPDAYEQPRENDEQNSCLFAFKSDHHVAEERNRTDYLRHRAAVELRVPRVGRRVGVAFRRNDDSACVVRNAGDSVRISDRHSWWPEDNDLPNPDAGYRLSSSDDRRARRERRTHARRQDRPNRQVQPEDGQRSSEQHQADDRHRNECHCTPDPRHAHPLTGSWEGVFRIPEARMHRKPRFSPVTTPAN